MTGLVTTTHNVIWNAPAYFAVTHRPKSFLFTNFSPDHPLAQNFNLTDGSVTITVPNVPPRNDYLIVCKYSYYVPPSLKKAT